MTTTSTTKNQWKNVYRIFFFGYNGFYNATELGAIDENIVNSFASESDAWDTLNNLNGLNPLLTFTILPVRIFIE